AFTAQGNFANRPKGGELYEAFYAQRKSQAGGLTTKRPVKWASESSRLRILDFDPGFADRYADSDALHSRVNGRLRSLLSSLRTRRGRSAKAVRRAQGSPSQGSSAHQEGHKIQLEAARGANKFRGFPKVAKPKNQKWLHPWLHSANLVARPPDTLIGPCARWSYTLPLGPI